MDDATLSRGDSSVTFKYDPFGRRIQKVFTQNSTTTTTNYLSDRNDSVEEIDQNGSVLARYSRTTNIDEPLAESRSGTANYYEADGLGSVTSLRSSAGALANTYTYVSSGNLTASSGSLTNPYRYTGREFDSETNLYFYRARYYDPVLGRFILEDPVGFLGGVNFYSYTFNGPVQWTDPTGLSARDVKRIQEACKNCTQAMVRMGVRANTTGRLGGLWNDLTTWFTKSWGCQDQAYFVQPCIQASPRNPYDDNWTFDVVPWGESFIVKGTDSNPNDPIVFCDPWRNFTWTAPRARVAGGGSW